MDPGEIKRLRRELTITRRRLNRAVELLSVVTDQWQTEYLKAVWYAPHFGRTPGSPIYNSARRLVSTARREWRLTKED